MYQIIQNLTHSEHSSSVTYPKICRSLYEDATSPVRDTGSSPNFEICDTTHSFYKSFTIFILAAPTFCNNCTISGVSCVNYCVARGFHCSPAGGAGGTCVSGGGNSCISPGVNYCINGAAVYVGCDAPYATYTCCC